jgi:ribosomal protein S18 acetylase RimI-like enzyme
MEVEFVTYKPEYRDTFIALNEAWLYSYELMEDIDRYILDHHEEYILDNGGTIVFAKYGDRLIGTFALIRKDEHNYELAKFAVDEAFRGHKVGKALCAKAIELAREKGARRLGLFSSSKLTPAQHLYRSFGFVQVPMDKADNEYATADVRMYLELGTA